MAQQQSTQPSAPTLLAERPNIEAYQGVYVSMEELVAMRANHVQLDLRGRRKALTAMAGAHQSSFRGRGIDFDEVRTYQPGDDVRNIDWRVTARTGQPHTKLFREERERPIYIVVDQSQSMFFGSQQAFKSVTAARAGAYLAWASRTHGDRIGGFLFNDDQVQEIRPKEGKRGIQQYLRVLVQFNQKLDANQRSHNSRVSFINALEGVQRVIRPGSLVFIISDFRGFDDISQQHLSLISRHSDLVAIQINDSLEAMLPPAGNYGFTDGQRAIKVNTRDHNLRKQYQLRFLARQETLKQRLISIGVALIHLDTSDAIIEKLNRALGLKPGR